MLRNTAVLLAVSVCTAFVAAAVPQLGGPMRHLLVSQVGNDLVICYETSPFSGQCGDAPDPLLLQDYGETYNPPADVLNGTYYNAQYGWLPNGYFNPPPNSAVYIELLSQTPGLSHFDAGTFSPIFTTGGSSTIWKWDGSMTHHWTAVNTCGDYEAIFRVYFGDAVTGVPIPGYGDDEILLMWTVQRDSSAPPDLDGDGDIDSSDFGMLQSCLTGADNGPVSAVCLPADLDVDCDVDSADILLFQQCAAGPAVAFDPACLE